MGMTGFSDAEMALLSGLDAVAWVTRTRITYTDSFKREAVTRYRRGESPVRIFREAGLDPRIIGNKLCFVKLGSAFCAVFFRSVGSGFSAGCAVSAAACLRCVGYLVMRACSLR